MGIIRVGTVGFAQGWYATLYSRACAQMKDVEFVGVCDLGETEAYVRACAETSAEAFAAELDVPLFHDLQDLLDLDLHALIVTSETADHHEHAIQAIRSGVHVFVGKPLTITRKAAEAILAALDEHPGIVLLPGQPGRYEDGMIQAHERIRKGEIGRPLMAYIYVNHPAMTNHEWEMRAERSGGPFIEFGSYPVDLAEWIIAAPIRSVYALGENFLHPQVDGPDNTQLLCRHTNGAISSLGVYTSIRWTYPFLGLEIIGERGCIRTDYHNYPVYVHGTEGISVQEPRYSLMNQREIEHFMDCVRGRTKPGITPREYLRTITVLEAAVTSLEVGQAVEVLWEG